MAKDRQKQEVCPNCSFKLGREANYCPNCGQENHVKIQSLKTLLGDWMEALLSFDTRMVRTVRALATSPGKITLLFQGGKHVSYVSPLRLYLFSSVLMFFMLNQYIKDKHLGEFDRDEILSDTSDLQFSIGFHSGTFEMTPREFARLHKAPRQTIDSVYLSQGLEDPGFFERLAIRQVAKMLDTGQGQYLLQVVRNTSIGMFILMPLFGAFLWIFFHRKSPFYVSHLVFSIHYHAVVFLFLSIGFIADIWVDWPLIGPLLGCAFVYQLFALKKVYQYPWKRTVGKFLWSNLLYLISLFFVVTGVSIVSLFTF